MKQRTVMAGLLALVVATAGRAESKVGVAGSEIQFDAEVTKTVAGKQVSFVLTGTALRERFLLNVYAMASYLAKDVKAMSADELAALDAHKMLQLVLERDVSGSDMAANVKRAILANYEEKLFPSELKSFVAFLTANPVQKGDIVWISHLPGVGVRCEIVGKTSVTIKNLKFSEAVWNIYLGKNNLGIAIKNNLTSRL